jgi:hypothetical protein
VLNTFLGEDPLPLWEQQPILVWNTYFRRPCDIDNNNMTVTERRNSEAIATVDFDECLSKDSSDHLLGRVLAGKKFDHFFLPP